MTLVQLAHDEHEIIALACSLNTEPGKNWVERAGGLPEFR